MPTMCKVMASSISVTGTAGKKPIPSFAEIYFRSTSSPMRLLLRYPVSIATHSIACAAFLALPSIGRGQVWVVDTLTTSPSATITDIEFLTPLKGFACGTNSFYRTMDGGSTWELEIPPVSIWDIEIASPTVLYRIGDDGFTQKSMDAGGTWNNTGPVGTTVNVMREAFFFNADSGWAMSYHPDNYSVSLHKTLDGGANWTTTPGPTSNTVHDILFLNDTVGFIGAMGGARIWRTQDGGDQWTVTDLPGSSITEIDFVSDSTGYAVGNDGVIYRTVDQGGVWNALNSGTSDNFTQVQFTDTLNGWAVGYNGTIVYTSNGGDTWLPQESNTLGQIQSLNMIGSTYGFAIARIVGSSTLVLRYGSYVETGNHVLGRLYLDQDSICDPTGAAGIFNRIVQATPGPYYAMTDPTGNYDLHVGPGTYTVQPAYPDEWGYLMEPACVPSFTVPFVGDGETVTDRDFGTSVTPCFHLEVFVGSNVRRRCFRNSTVISYSNNGSITAPDAAITVHLPEHVVPISASLPWTVDNTGALQFTVGDLAPMTYGTILMVDSVVCNDPEILGLTQCTRVVITPPNPCAIGAPEHDGSDLHVSTECLNMGVGRFVIRNTGAAMTDSVEYRIYRDAQWLSSGNCMIAAGDSLVMAFQTNGQTYRVEVDERPGHPLRTSSNATLENCKPDAQSTATSGFVTARPPDDEPADEDIDCMPIVASMDPNDKGVNPEGVGSEHRVDPNTSLTYLVRFQNTGSDTAFTVVIVDTLSQFLDPTSLRITTASHAFIADLSGSGSPVLEVRFADILLPDSTTDEAASHGFVQFTIDPKENTPLGTVVENTADIYFDFNDPIRTDTEAITYDLEPEPAPGSGPELLSLPTVFGDTLVCLPAMLNITVVGTEPLWWSNAQAPTDTLSTGSVLGMDPNPGTYAFIAHASEGTDTVVVRISPSPVISLGSDTSICSWSTLLLEPGPFASYAWQDGSTGSAFLVSDSGWYEVIVANPAGCTAHDSIFVGLADCSTGIGAQGSGEVVVQPNPCTDRINVLIPEANGAWWLRMQDLSGRSLRFVGPVSGTSISVDMAGLSPGVVVIILENSCGFKATYRIVKN